MSDVPPGLPPEFHADWNNLPYYNYEPVTARWRAALTALALERETCHRRDKLLAECVKGCWCNHPAVRGGPAGAPANPCDRCRRITAELEGTP